MPATLLACLVALAPPNGRGQFQSWLDRPTPVSPRFLEHGTVEFGIAAGTPHGYRLELRTGLFDVASLGLTSHWMPGQTEPRVWPIAALAFWRGPMFGFGAHYRPVLFAPGFGDPRFEARAHFALASFTIGSGLFGCGLDVGAAHVRVAHVDPGSTAFTEQTVFGGGFVVRVGNEWIGASADALAAVSTEPLLVFELALDLRFDLAKVRSDGAR